jgi:hypothetical protein
MKEYSYNSTLLWAFMARPRVKFTFFYLYPFHWWNFPDTLYHALSIHALQTMQDWLLSVNNYGQFTRQQFALTAVSWIPMARFS